MAITIDFTVFFWLTALLPLVLNLIFTFIPIDLIPNDFANPLLSSIFVTEAILFMLQNGEYDNDIINRSSNSCIILIFTYVIFENITNSKKSNQDSALQQDEGDNKSQQNEEESKILEKLGPIKLLDVIFVFLIWGTYIADSIYRFKNYYYDEKNYKKYNLKVPINDMFVPCLHLATLQFAYCTYFSKLNLSKMSYYIIMIPQAILYSLSAIIAYHMEEKIKISDDDITNARGCLNSIMSGILLLKGFKIVFESKEEESTNKIIFSVMFCLGFLWLLFVSAIPNINQ